jgi:hypothetical protein
MGFLVWPQSHGRWFVSGLASKPLGQVSLVGPLKIGSYNLVILASKLP